jgi:hypothetical protein
VGESFRIAACGQSPDCLEGARRDEQAGLAAGRFAASVLSMKTWILPALICVLFAPPPSAVQAQEKKTVRVLSIGNSFSRNATQHLAKLVEAGGHELIHTDLVIGGASFEVHADKADLHESGTDKQAGLYSNGLGLRENLRAEQWDFVTIQQASIKSHDYSTYQPYAGRLADRIRKLAPGARLLVHQTWAYRVDDPRFTKPSGSPGEPRTQEEMHRGLTAAYNRIAKELGGDVIPVGDAFFLADTDPVRGYKPEPGFDPRKARAPSLPDQTHSLHSGWRWSEGKDGGGKRLGMDGHHANLAGQYLGACVWYEVLFGESAVGNMFVPAGLDAGYARFLQETAHRAVRARAEAGQGGDVSAEVMRSMPGLVAFWDFQEEGGQPRVSASHRLQERKGPVERVEGGVFGPFSARIKRGQWMMIERGDLGALNIHGKGARVTVASWVWREDKSSWQAVAGVWDETRKKRQYCLFLNAPRGTRADEMKRYPLANRIHGHVSAIGGPTPGEDFCITYSSGATEIPMQSWQFLVMRYDGAESRVYVNGKLDALEQYNPFPYPDGLFDGGEDGADFTVGAVHRGGEWGNFFGGRLGGLAVFDRALTDREIESLAEMTGHSAPPQ